MTKPKVAFIGTGGTIASLGRHPFDIQDYGANGQGMHADEILAKAADAAKSADSVTIKGDITQGGETIGLNLAIGKDVADGTITSTVE